MSGIDAYVWLAATRAQGLPAPLASLSAQQWEESTEQPLRDFIGFMQSAHRRLVSRGGGRIVVVIPTIAMTGAAGLAPWSAVADGCRALVKSAARVWGAASITANCVAVPAALLAGTEDDISRSDLQQPALPDPHLRDVAGVIASLCRAEMGAVSGATIGVDGGRWMNP
ncbi:MAG: SDR family oxidoreductase [Frankiaceae bacterium]|nr:SDR family oxidoreductase [Frankiaceae bacterium]MBV9870766.1 SDR family oxidoreductase [Frankiaceae bacterium]